jgi:hypothetical protein
MSSFKKLSKSDVSVVPYHANKQWTFNQSTYTTYSTLYTGTNIAGVFSLSEASSSNQYNRLIYAQINQLFYQAYPNLLNTSSLASSLYYESVSQQRPTASYFVFNDNDNLISNFPTTVGQTIKVLAVNQIVFGGKILPNSFTLTSGAYNIFDDGFGNLYDDAIHIGNIIYAQGLIIITNQSYQTVFSEPTFTLEFKNDHIIYENEVRCLVKESDFNLSYNPTLVTNYASGSVKGFATSSSFYTYATGLGLYNDNNELVAVAKFGKPMLISPDTDMTFVVKYDT